MADRRTAGQLARARAGRWHRFDAPATEILLRTFKRELFSGMHDGAPLDVTFWGSSRVGRRAGWHSSGAPRRTAERARDLGARPDHPAPVVASGALRATTHQIAGIGLAVATAAALDAPAGTTALLLAGAWLGSLLPDADKAGSRIYQPRRLERRVWPLRIAGWLARIPLRLLTLLKHRGVTHSLAAAALVAFACSFVSRDFALGVAIGYVAHIAADACTPGGVPLLAPLTRRRWWLLPRRGRIPTGSLRELAVAALLTAGAVAAALTL